MNLLVLVDMQFDTSYTTYFGNDEFLVSVVLLLLEFLRA